LLLQQRQSTFSGYKQYIGEDITSLVALPLWIMEPYTMLQKIAEIMEYRCGPLAQAHYLILKQCAGR
jgi:hypothetical protein